MTEAELVPGLRTSILGFGTAGFGARLSERERQRLLDAAFDAGIRHFDTAPLYGDGGAERSVGRFLRGRRDAVTVAAKVGLAPARGGRGAPLLRRLGVAAARRIGSVDAHMSLERTLRALETDHVDLLLLHECDVGSALADDWHSFLDDCVSRGLARATGIATSRGETLRILQAADAAFPAVVQVAAGTPVPAERGAIFHSIFVGGSTLEAALAAHPRALALFSSTRPERIVENARLAG